MTEFWENVDRPAPDACWAWERSRNSYGYGRVYYRKDGKQHERGAHRIAWELANQSSILPGIYVCHKCDNPKCCNPAHLFLGTNQDNQLDAKAKGRLRPATGEKHWNAKFSDYDVSLILHWVRNGVFLQKEIARAYGVRHSCISRIVSGTRRGGHRAQK